MSVIDMGTLKIRGIAGKSRKSPAYFYLSKREPIFYNKKMLKIFQGGYMNEKRNRNRTWILADSIIS